MKFETRLARLSSERGLAVKFELELPPQRNDEIRMTNDELSPNDQMIKSLLRTFWASSFLRHSTFVLRHYACDMFQAA
jgi:hypothetical protein